MAAKIQGESCSFGPWEIISRKGPILRSDDADRITRELEIPALPEMVFGETSLKIQNKEKQFSLNFGAVDALRLVDNKNDLMKVAAAAEWQKQRADCEFIKDVVNPYDWTYSTSYKGTILGESNITESDTSERIDLEKLKKKEKINFYADLLLFEDELGDNGISKLNVKMRVMPSSFFVLLRFFLRVDDVMIRVNETRIYHEAGSNYILREFHSKEKKMNQLPNPMAEENILVEQLECVREEYTKLTFEPSVER